MTLHDHPVTVAAPGVLMNDSATPPGPLSAILVSNPANGSLAFNANGSFTYTPNAGFVGSDSFTYKASDGVEDSNTATVSISVMNTAPSAGNDSYMTLHDQALTEAAPGVLSNDFDMNGDPITPTLVDDVSNGMLAFNSDGSFTYTPNPGFVGSDSFTYKVSDGLTDSNIATVSIGVVNNAPYFDASSQTFELHEGELYDGDVLGTVVATDPDGDPLAYTSLSNLADLGLTLVTTVLPDGRNAVKVVVSDSFKLWEEVVQNPGKTFDISASDGWADVTKHFFLIPTSKKGGGGTAVKPWHSIPGYPSALPPAGKVTVILAVRGKHSFVILLNSAGTSTCFSGDDTGGKLDGGSGAFGTYEPYNEAKQSFQILPGVFDEATISASMNATNLAIDTANQNYILQNNNCHCASTAYLTRAGIPLPATADAAGKIGISLGWQKMPDGVSP